jgi:putative ABC transport system permease protein
VEPNPAWAALWLPYTLQPQMEDLFDASPRSTCIDSQSDLPACRELRERESRWLSLAGRLAPGYSRAAAAAELKILMSGEAYLDPDAAELKLTDGSAWSTGPPDAAWILALVLTLPTLIALIVCANVASLLLSRAVKRQQDMAIRLAIGGSRLKLVRMLLAEQMLLAGAAAVLSLWLVNVLPSIIVAQVPGMRDVLVSGTDPDWRVLAYLAAVAFLTAIGAGTAPALESLNVQLGQSLQGRAALSGHHGISRTQGLLIGVQVALSMVPIVGAAAFLRAERQLISPGFDAPHVAVASVARESDNGLPLEWPTERVEALPGARSVALAASLPPFAESEVTVERPGAAPREFPSMAVSPSYFRTLGIALVSGRTFHDEDYLRGGSEEAAIVSAELARRLFPGQSAVGQTFDGAPVRQPSNADQAATRTRFEIVGVAADTATGPNAIGTGRSLIYQLIDRASARSVDHNLLVRVEGDARQFLPVLQSTLKPVVNTFVSAFTLQSVLDERRDVLQVLTTLVMVPAAVSLTLALIGVFGILAFTAAQRRKEVAIRAAVGASRAAIFGSIIRPALRPTGVGVVIGAAASFGALRFFESVEPGLVSLSVDVVAYLVGACLMLCAALAAMSSPAWRATVADPVRALREE